MKTHFWRVLASQWRAGLNILELLDYRCRSGLSTVRKNWRKNHSFWQRRGGTLQSGPWSNTFHTSFFRIPPAAKGLNIFRKGLSSTWTIRPANRMQRLKFIFTGSGFRNHSFSPLVDDLDWAVHSWLLKSCFGKPEPLIAPAPSVWLDVSTPPFCFYFPPPVASRSL